MWVVFGGGKANKMASCLCHIISNVYIIAAELIVMWGDIPEKNLRTVKPTAREINISRINALKFFYIICLVRVLFFLFQTLLFLNLIFYLLPNVIKNCVLIDFE